MILTTCAACAAPLSLAAPRCVRCQMRYAMAFYHDHGSTISDLHKAVETLEDLELTARRVLGSSHPLVGRIGEALRESRAVLRDREALLAKYLLYAASALAIAAFALAQRSRRSR